MARLFASVYLIIFLSVFLTRADVFLGSSGVLPISPALMFALAALPVWLVTIYRESLSPVPFRIGARILVTARWPIIWFLLLVIGSLISAFYSRAYWQGGGRTIFLVCFGAFVFLTGLVLASSPVMRRVYRPAIAFALLLALASVGYDLIFPGAFSTQEHRAAGLASNANTSAFILVALAIAYVRVDRLTYRDALVLSLTGLGVFFTLSRSGMLMYAAAATAYAYHVRSLASPEAKSAGRFLVIAMIAALTIFAASLAAESLEIFQNVSSQRRIAMFAGEGSLWGRGEARIEIIDHYFAFINQAPVLGLGAMYSLSQQIGPHNMYLDRWVNDGLIGLLSYMGLLFSSFLVFHRRGDFKGRIFVVIAAANGLFSHNVLYSKSFLLLLGLMLGFSALDSIFSRKELSKDTPADSGWTESFDERRGAVPRSEPLTL